jgi:hypothetical protein
VIKGAFDWLGGLVAMTTNRLPKGRRPISSSPDRFDQNVSQKKQQCSEQGLQRQKSGAYMWCVSIFRRCATQIWALGLF